MLSAALVLIAHLALALDGKTIVRKLDSEEDVAVALAKYTASLSHKFTKEMGSFSIALSRDTLIYTMRAVPLTDPLSNYKLAFDGFLSKVPIQKNNAYSIPYKNSPSDTKKLVLVEKIIILISTDRFPIFDIILNGIGFDSHITSLFPNRPQ
ncbi:6-phosphogluconolactonase [Striga asiatica]|uniref:6-phosphogluconolactonase n=1 Tax=Striga asiatica TaxID=4170 RepID=A0A5A7PL42_STRAF|nr:6-phosphogluconolactonase [Striga asiatica]